MRLQNSDDLTLLSNVKHRVITRWASAHFNKGLSNDHVQWLSIDRPTNCAGEPKSNPAWHSFQRSKIHKNLVNSEG
jgi:hypothetical protein